MRFLVETIYTLALSFENVKTLQCVLCGIIDLLADTDKLLAVGSETLQRVDAMSLKSVKGGSNYH
jgi:hypothetical protein